MFTYIFIILGFIFLINGAQLLVDGASSLAKRFGISNLVIGLTIVSFGTALPELFLGVVANWQGLTDTVFSNVLSNNITKIFLIGGLAALINPIRFRGETAKNDILLSIFSIIILFFLANDLIVKSIASPILSRIDGLILIILFIIFIYFTLGQARAKKQTHPEHPIFSFWHSAACLIIGVIGLTIGGKWTIDNVLIIAKQFDLSGALIGSTILAIGASLPELVTAAVASFKKNSDLAIGNIIGSNLFNIFFILGLNALIKPMAFNQTLDVDLLICFLSTAALYYFILSGRIKKQVERWEGALLFIAYFFYLGFLFWRG